MAFTKAYLLPGIVIAILIGTFVITYIISVVLKHVRPFFPYISDTGTTPPESTIFGQLLNIGSVFIFIAMFVRYLQVKICYGNPELRYHYVIMKINRICVFLAIFTSLGVSMAANFQETVAFVPHIIGAFTCFGTATLYFCMQTIISYLGCPLLNTLMMARYRMVLTILSFITSTFAGCFGIAAYIKFKKPIDHMPKWGPEDGGFEIHIVSSISEWLVTFIFAFYIATFTKEFRSLIVHLPKAEVKESPVKSPDPNRVNYKKEPEDNVKTPVPSEIVNSKVHPI